MSEIAMNAAHMIDMLPDPDKNLAYELIKSWCWHGTRISPS